MSSRLTELEQSMVVLNQRVETDHEYARKIVQGTAPSTSDS